MSTPLYANLSIDLDNKWAYLRTAKKTAWETFPSYLPQVIPRIRSHLAKSNMKATVFIVGRDLDSQENVSAIQELVDAGHAIGNHSMEHEPWLHVFDRERLDQEITGTHKRIEEKLGVTPVGFRGPGYSDSPMVHEMLRQNGYKYVASAFPSSVGPIARTFYLLRTGLKRDGERKKMFGSWWDVFGKNRPYILRSPERPLWMFPVTTQPLTRLPIHFTYLFFLSEYSPQLARLYFRATLQLCRLFRVEPSLLLHPLDFLGSDDEPDLSFFPGMRLPRDRKLMQLDWFLETLARQFQVVTMEHHWDRLQLKSNARTVVPSNITSAAKP